MRKEIDFWLIDSNCVGVIRFYVKSKNKNDLSDDILIEEGIVMGSYGENAPLMKSRREMNIKDARLFWKNLINEGWQKTNSKW